MPDLPGVGDQLLNKMANWPKWASEESIENLTTTVARGNKQIADLNRQMITLMREQKNAANKQDKQSAANAKTQASSALNTRILGNSSSMLKNLNVGFASMLKEQQRANALLRAMNAKLGGTRTQSMRDQATRMNNTFGGGLNRRSARRTLEDDQLFDNLSRQTKRAFEQARSTMGSSSADIKRNADQLAKDMRNKFGSAIDPAIDKFRTQIDTAANDLGRVDKAMRDFGKNISHRQDPRESSKDYYERMKRVGLEQMGGLGEMLSGGKGAVAGGIFASMMKIPALARFAPMIAAASAALGAFTGVVSQLFELWKGSTVQTTQALSQGLVGLTDSVLSFAIHAKTAGLTVEQFSKLVQSAGGMVNLLDANARDAGRAFAGGVKSYLDAARAFNYFGMSLDDLNRNFGRQIQIVALAGMRGEQAIKTAQDMALREADTVYRLSVATGKPVERLNAAFDELYRNDMFRMATTRMLARGEQRAAAEVSNLARAFVAASDEFGKGLAEELSLSAIAGVDPAMLGENYRQMMMMFPEMERAIRQAQQEGRSPEEIRAVIAQQAQGIMRNPAYQGQLGMMAMSPDMRPMLRFLQQAGEARTDVAAAGGPTTEGARGAAAEIDRQRAMEMAKAEILGAIEATGVMKAFEALSRVAFEVVDAFAGLPDILKKTVLGFTALVAILGLMALRGAGGGLGGFGRGGAPGSAGVPPGGPPRPGTPGAPGAATPTAPGAASVPPGGPPRTGTPPVPGAPTAPTAPTAPAAPAAPAAPGGAPRPPVPPVPPVSPTPAVPVTPTTPVVPPTPAVPPVPPAPAVPGVPTTPTAPGGAPRPPVPPTPAVPPTPTPPPTPPGVQPPGTPLPPPSAAAGTATKMATALKGVGGSAARFGALGAVLGLGINEFTTVAGLENARTQVLDKYRRGEISREDAQKALVEIDDAIAGSRGGSLARSGVSAAGGTVGGTAGAVAGLGAASIPTGIAGAIGGSMAADWLFGDTAERAGSWIGRQFGGGSNRAAGRELDAIRPLAEQPGPRPQPGATSTRESRRNLMIANAPVTQGQPLSQNQMAAIGMALQTSPENARNYPAWVIEQYNRQRSSGATPGTAATPGVPAGTPSTGSSGSTPSTDARPRTSGAVQTPDSRAMRPIDAQAAAAAAATTGSSQTMAQASREQNTQDNVRNLVERQDRTNELLAAMLSQQTIQTSDARRTVDVLETLNNKS